MLVHGNVSSEPPRHDAVQGARGTDGCGGGWGFGCGPPMAGPPLRPPTREMIDSNHYGIVASVYSLSSMVFVFEVC